MTTKKKNGVPKREGAAAKENPAETPGKTKPGRSQKSKDQGTNKSSPGLDDAKHAAAQKAAQQAELLRKGLFPSLMASALGLDNLFNSPAYKLFLERLLEDAGSPKDPIEVMLLQQLALAHFRIGQLHVSAGQAKGTEAAKIYNSVAARMLGEFRRTALALRVYRGRVREDSPEADAATVKIYKAAQ